MRPENPGSKIAVVIPAYNQASTLARAVESALAQDLAPDEIAVIDDHSTDETSAVLNRFNHPRLKCYRFDQHRGANAARNRGVQMVRSPLIAFLDADDVYLPHRLRHAAEMLAANPEINAQHCSFRTLSRRGTRDVVNPNLVLTDRALSLPLAYHVLPLTTSALVVRRTALEEIGGFDEALARHQDRDLLLRLAVRHKVAFTPDIAVEKLQHRQSISHKFDGYVAGMEALASKHAIFREPELRSMLDYLAIRMIIKAFLGGRWRAAVHEWRRLAQSPALRGGPGSALFSYRAGRKLRQKLVRDMAAIQSGSSQPFRSQHPDQL